MKNWVSLQVLVLLSLAFWKKKYPRLPNGWLIMRKCRTKALEDTSRVPTGSLAPPT